MNTPEAIYVGLQQFNLSRIGFDSPDAEPYALTHDSQVWAIGTDGHALILVRQEAVTGTLMASPESVAKLAGRWLSTAAASPAIVNAGRLKAFCGVGRVVPDCATCKNARVLECEDCDGSGEVECECRCGHTHDADCDRCNDGKVICPDCGENPTQPVAILSAVLNRVLLRRVLAAVLPADDAPIALSVESLTRKSETEPVYLLRDAREAMAWMALVMPLRDRAAMETFDVAGEVVQR